MSAGVPTRRALLRVAALAATLGACSGGAAATLGPTSPHLQLAAHDVAFDRTDLTVPAGVPFAIDFAQRDPGIPHDVDIRRADGTTVFDGDVVDGPGAKTYAVGPLQAGTYTYICSVHPIPAMTGTLTVR